MSNEIIYTNSQVEQLKYETYDQFAVLKDKIKPIKFITETLKVRDVQDTSIQWAKVRIAYHIEGHSSQFAENEYAYPVIYNVGVADIPRFYVVVPTNPNRIVELTDDDTLRVDYMAYGTWE